MKKFILVGISVLAVSILISASFSNVVGYDTVKASQETEYVDVSVQPCGVKEFGNTSVKLTRQQCKNLTKYLETFNERLNQTKTRSDALTLFKDAVLELNKYGLLPSGMSIEKAQQLVTNSYPRSSVKPVLKHSEPSDMAIGNLFCLLSMKSNGETNDMVFGLLSLPMAVLLVYFLAALHFLSYPGIILALGILLAYSAIIGIPSFIFNLLSPLLLWSFVIANGVYSGWSLGLKGMQPITNNLDWVVGFKGLRIYIPGHLCIYLGQALATVNWV